MGQPVPNQKMATNIGIAVFAAVNPLLNLAQLVSMHLKTMIGVIMLRGIV